MPRNILKAVFAEIGLARLFSVPSNARWLLMLRVWRMLAFGMCSIMIVQFFKELGFSERKTGLFMALTLIGDVVISLVLTSSADSLGRRIVLLYGALMMAVSGVIFALFSNFYVLLLASIIGVISPSGGEVGPFRAVEESALAHILTLEHRTDVYAWYTVLGALAGSSGAMCGGLVLQTMREGYGYSALQAYRLIFWLYACAGFIKFVSTLFLTHDIELEPKEIEPVISEETGLLENQTVSRPTPDLNKPKGIFSHFVPQLSDESRKIVPALCMLFALDAFASSLSSISWIAYYVSNKFPVKDSTLGSIFFTTGIVGSFASLGGSSLSRRLGPLLTMVVTHLPSSTLLMFIPLPHTVTVTIGLLILRACTSNMDVAPRQVFLSAVVLKEERTAVMGWVNVVKTASQVVGPYVTGSFAARNMQWISFVMAGGLKVAYDLGILATFLSIKLDRDN